MLYELMNTLQNEEFLVGFWFVLIKLKFSISEMDPYGPYGLHLMNFKILFCRTSSTLLRLLLATGHVPNGVLCVIKWQNLRRANIIDKILFLKRCIWQEKLILESRCSPRSILCIVSDCHNESHADPIVEYRVYVQK
jgi:hypothetical protein